MEINLTSSSSSSSLSNISLDLKEDRERISDKIFWVRVYNDVISLQSVRVTIIVVYIIVILIATFGNIIVILVIYRRRSLRRNPAILLILNLTFCDLISCVVYRPLLLVELFLPFVSNYEVFHDQLDKCRAASYFQGLLAGVGFHTMVLISQERLLLIVFPLRAKVICTYKRTLKLLALIWITSSLLHLPVPLKFEEVITVNVDGTILSFCGHFSGSTGAKVYFSIMFVFYFALPLATLTVSYAKIFQTLFHSSCELDTSNQGQGGEKAMHTRRKLAKMMLSVSVVFAVCWGPNFLFFLWVYCGGRVRQNGFFTATIVQFLPIISSAINPFIYTINSQTFQSGFKRILCPVRFLRREDDSIYRSFNSLHSPSCNCPNNGHLNSILSPQHLLHRNSTFSSRRNSCLAHNNQMNYYYRQQKRNHLLHKNTCNSLSAHARRNTFIDISSANRWKHNSDIASKCPHTAPVTPLSASPFLPKRPNVLSPLSIQEI